jgi:hypothetical protein
LHTCSEDIETAHLVAGRVTDCTPARGAVKALAEAAKHTTAAAAFIVAYVVDVLRKLFASELPGAGL